MDQNFNNGLANFLSTLQVVLSASVLTAINIIISGQLLGYVFQLTKRGTHIFKIRIPPTRTKSPMLNISITGDQVPAGFTATIISLLVTGLYFHGLAKDIFIYRLQATSSQWVASSLMSTTLSVIACLMLSMFRMGIVAIQTQIAIQSKPSPPSEQEIKKEIISPDQLNTLFE